MSTEMSDEDRARVAWNYWPQFDVARLRVGEADRELLAAFPGDLVDLADRAEWLLLHFEASAVTSARALVLPHLADAETEIDALAQALDSLLVLVAAGGFTDEDLNARRHAFEAAINTFSKTVAMLPLVDVTQVVDVARSEISRVRASAGQHVRHVESELRTAHDAAAVESQRLIDEVQTELTNARSRLVELENQIANTTGGFEATGTELRDALTNVRGHVEAYEQSLSSRADETIARFDSRGNVAAEALETLEVAMSTTLSATADAFDESRVSALSEFEEAVKSSLDDLDVKWAATQQDLLAEHKVTMAAAADVLDDAKKTLNATATAAHSKQYTTTAKAEGITAVVYQLVGTAAVLWAVYIVSQIVQSSAKVNSAHSGEVLAALTAGRIAISSLLTGLAVYFFRQANTHRRHQVNARQRALIMATHHSFIATLSEASQKRLTEQMAEGPIFQISSSTDGSHQSQSGSTSELAGLPAE